MAKRVKKKRTVKKVVERKAPDKVQREYGKFRSYRLARGLHYKTKDYEYDSTFVPATSMHDIHTTPELVHFAEKNKNISIDARVLVVKQDGSWGYKRYDKARYLAAFKENKRRTFTKKLRESFGEDFDTAAFSGKVGQDFVPLLAGPFYKQLYYHDYLRMHSLAFHAYHHDPVGKRTVHIMRDFTLGRGFRVDFEDPKAQALWEAFSQVNDLEHLMEQIAVEISIYGEVFVWTLPNNQTGIEYNVRPGQEVPRGILPRVRLIDPSVIWEIVTYPEDIKRVLYYQWVAPTQYQIYTGSDQGSAVPGMKFITQQVPAAQVRHFKTNSVSNEKRGRSDLFPALGYMKRLRDNISYSSIALLKAAAWSIDTTIEGDDNDISNYIKGQTTDEFQEAGSEFVHSNLIKREYIGNTAGRAGGNDAGLDWSLSACAMAMGIPIDYYGTHLSGGSTKAAALVSTEPVAKMFESRQGIYKRIIEALAKDLLDKFADGLGIENRDLEITFPEIVVQDRTAKLNDLAVAESRGWISKKRAAEIAAKELAIDDFSYEEEKVDIDAQEPTVTPLSSPLSAPAGDTSRSETSTDARASLKQTNKL